MKPKAVPTLFDVDPWRQLLEEIIYVPSDAVPRLRDALDARPKTGHWWNVAEFQELSQLVVQAVDALEEQEKRILSTGVRLEVQCATDVVRHVLERVQTCYEQSSCNAVQAIRRNHDIADNIAECKAELTAVIESFCVPREIEVSLNGQGPPERIQMGTLKELEYDRVDALYGHFLLNAKPKGDTMILGRTTMDRATYNATVLAMVATLKELRSEMLSFPVGDLSNKLRLMDLIDASWLDECFQGTLVNEEKYVVLRTIQAIPPGSAAARKAEEFLSEKVHIWAKLTHKNVHPIYGYVAAFKGRDCTEYIGLISPFYEKTSVKCTDSFWGAPRPKLRFLREAAAGMQYLHENNIVHGALKASKLLLNDEGTVVVAYAGMAELLDALWETQDIPWRTWLDPRTHNVWDAPETFGGGTRTLKADVWSFAMVMFELFTGKRPWHEYPRGLNNVMPALHESPGVRPERPEDEIMATDDVWALMQDCWKTNPDERPDFAEIHTRLEKAEAAFSEKQSCLPPQERYRGWKPKRR